MYWSSSRPGLRRRSFQAAVAMRPSAALSPGPVPGDQRDPSAFRMAQPSVNGLVGDDASAQLVAQTPTRRADRPPAVDFQRLEAWHGLCGKLAAQGTLPRGLA